MASPPAARAASSHDFPMGCIESATEEAEVFFNAATTSPLMVSLMSLMLSREAFRLVA